MSFAHAHAQVRRLIEELGRHATRHERRRDAWLRTGSLVHRIAPRSDGTLAVSYVEWDEEDARVAAAAAAAAGGRGKGAGEEGQTRGPAGGGLCQRTIVARRVIYAAPLFTASHVIEGFAPAWLRAFSYAPWLVANLHLARMPSGGAPRCDNVLYGPTEGLGYTLSAARGWRAMLGLPPADGLSAGAGVLTYYRALTDGEPRVARARMARTTWAEWRDLVLAELQVAHPEITEITSRLDVRLIGHAMARPTPGMIWGEARAAAVAARPLGAVHFAHSDLSALPLVEEAIYWGTRAAAEVALAL